MRSSKPARLNIPKASKSQEQPKQKKPLRGKGASSMPLKHPDISARLQHIKEGLGITWEQMAADLKVTSVTLRAIAQNRAAPNYYILRRLKLVYGVPYEYMIDGVNEPVFERQSSLLKRMEELNKIVKRALSNPGKPGPKR